MALFPGTATHGVRGPDPNPTKGKLDPKEAGVTRVGVKLRKQRLPKPAGFPGGPLVGTPSFPRPGHGFGPRPES